MYYLLESDLQKLIKYKKLLVHNLSFYMDKKSLFGQN